MTERDSFASVIRANIALLKFCGVISYGSGNCFRRSNGERNVLATLAYGCLLTYSILYMSEFALRTAYLDTWMESFTMLLSLVSGQARFTILLLFRSRFQRLLSTCEELWATLNVTEKKCVRDYAKPTQRLTYFYLFGCAFTIFFYAVASLFVVQRDEWSNVTTRVLPYACLLEVSQTPYYEIIYTMQLCSMINVGVTCVATDTIGPVLILTVSGHFKVLNSRMKNCPITAESLQLTLEKHNVTRNRARPHLHLCVQYHQIVFEFCKEIEKLTTAIFLTQLLGSTYNISLVGFKLVGDDPDKFKYTTQLSIAVIQLYLCNWPADVLLTESEAISKAVYCTSWYHLPYELKRSLNIIALRSQKAAQLTAGYFVPLSLQTFASMVSTAASFFTMISSMN